MPVVVTDWEKLRQHARQLENEIDSKLMSFSKLCSNYLARDQSSYHLSIDTLSTASVLSFDTMSMEIEKLLEKLSDMNKGMADAIPALLGSNAAASHTLQRHNEICQDYRREFERTKANLRNFQTREDRLIHSNVHDTDSRRLNGRRQDHFIREGERLHDMDRSVNEVVDRALNLKQDLFHQRRFLMNVTHKVKSLANRFPLMNNMLQKIRIKKRKDSLVLGFVIALCLVFLLLFMFR